MNIDINQFCDTQGDRPNFSKPFTHGEFTYATDNRIVIRVPKIDGFGPPPNNQSGSPIIGRLLDYFSAADKPAKLYPVEGVPVEDKKCPHCGGTGKLKELLNVPIKFHGRKVNAFWLDLISRLPNAKLAPGNAEADPMRFTFDGGDGLLMPMRDDA